MLRTRYRQKMKVVNVPYIAVASHTYASKVQTTASRRTVGIMFTRALHVDDCAVERAEAEVKINLRFDSGFNEARSLSLRGTHVSHPKTCPVTEQRK